jgi:hypothetical protein
VLYQAVSPILAERQALLLLPMAAFAAEPHYLYGSEHSAPHSDHTDHPFRPHRRGTYGKACVLIRLLLSAQSAIAQNTTPLTSEELSRRTIERRAVDAVIWGVPVVSLDMMRQAYFRDGKAQYNNIIWWPKGATWMNQSLATNTIVRYIYFFSNTKKSGPVVFELPPAVAGAAGFYGTIMDAWQVPLTDVGVGGKGGKYLLLPPDFKGEVPGGYIPLRLKTYNSYTLVRSILASNSEEVVRTGDALVKKIKVYPLSEAAHPPQQRFVDMTGLFYEPGVPYNVDFYVSLARMINEEPAQTKDMEMLGMLLPLGIEKGKTFDPDSAKRTVLNASASEAQAWLLDGIARVAVLWWPGEHWVIPTAPVGLKTTFLWQVPEFFDVDGRGITLADWFGPVSKLGGSSFYLAAYFDVSWLATCGWALHFDMRVLGPLGFNRDDFTDERRQRTRHRKFRLSRRRRPQRSEILCLFPSGPCDRPAVLLAPDTETG